MIRIRSRHNVLPFHFVLSHKAVGCKLQGFAALSSAQHKKGKKKVIPDPHYIDDRNRRSTGFQHWKNNTGKKLKLVAAVNKCALLPVPGECPWQSPDTGKYSLGHQAPSK